LNISLNACIAGGCVMLSPQMFAAIGTGSSNNSSDGDNSSYDSGSSSSDNSSYDSGSSNGDNSSYDSGGGAGFDDFG
jgi:hypothetical protein